MNSIEIATLLCLYALLGWGWSAINARYLGDFFSPFNLLLYFWILPYLISMFRISAFQTGLTFEAHMTVITATAILVTASVFPMLLLNRMRDGKARFISSVGIEIRKPFLVILFYLLTLMALYWAEFRGIEPALLSYLATDASDSGLHRVGKDSRLQVLAAGAPVAGMFIIYLGLSSRSFSRKILLFTLASLVPILGILKASKSDVFIPLLIYSAVIYYNLRLKNRGGAKWPLVALFGISVLTVLLTTIRIEGVGYEGGFTQMIGFRLPFNLSGPVLEMLANIYGYYTLGFQNFSNYLIYGSDDYRIGTSIFRPVLSMFMQGELARSLDVSYEVWYMRLGPANIGTYLRDLYIEGGIGFCILGTLLYAAAINFIYIKFRTKGKVWLLIYITSLFPWIWIFFQNAFSVLQIYANIFYAIVLYKVVGSSRTRSGFPESYYLNVDVRQPVSVAHGGSRRPRSGV